VKANLDSHAAKHQKNKLKSLLWRKFFFWEIEKAQHMCALTKVDAPLFWKKVLAKGAHYGQDQCNYAFGRLSRASWPVSATYTITD
jgi:hypothetical protein